MFYYALIQKDENDFAVTFPDFPGCFSIGSTMEEASLMAEEAILLHIDGLTPLPTPTQVVDKHIDSIRIHI